MPHVLHVVVIFHGVDELFHVLDIFGVVQLLIVLRNHLDLGGDELVALGFQSGGDVVEVIRLGVDGEHGLFGFKVGGAGTTTIYVTSIPVLCHTECMSA